MNLLTKSDIEALLDGGIVGQCDLRDHAGDLARTALDALARLEDAEAALALVVERAAETALNIRGDFYGVERAAAIRALASPSGVEALAALRAERDMWRANYEGRTVEAADLHARLAAAEGRVAALTEAASDLAGSMRAIRDNTPSPGAKVVATAALRQWDAALATVTPPATEYERKVAQMKEDFPNGI